MMEHSNILFVTGTDTGIGKTTVSCLLLEDLRQQGHILSVMKPVETGCRDSYAQKLFAADAERLRQAAGSELSQDEICPYRFQPPLAPLACAEDAGKAIDLDRLVAQAEKLASSADLLLIEGAGGVLVPLAETATFVDFALACRAVVLVVVGSKLGAINHAMLTFSLLRSREVPCIGYVLNEPTENTEEHGLQANGLSARSTNRSIIRRLAKSYEIEELEFLEFGATSAKRLREAVVSHFGLAT